jgi:hypothetical protein
MAILTTLIVGSTALMNAPTFAAGACQKQFAHTARSVNGTVTACLHLVGANGTKLYEEGPVTGALPGSMKAAFHAGTTSFTGSFTIRTHGSTIDGRGYAIPHGSGRYQSFGGTITITGGSGRYKHASGKAGLYGIFDRRTETLEVQTTGNFSY